MPTTVLLLQFSIVVIRPAITPLPLLKVQFLKLPILSRRVLFQSSPILVPPDLSLQAKSPKLLVLVLFSVAMVISPLTSTSLLMLPKLASFSTMARLMKMSNLSAPTQSMILPLLKSKTSKILLQSKLVTAKPLISASKL